MFVSVCAYVWDCAQMSVYCVVCVCVCLCIYWCVLCVSLCVYAYTYPCVFYQCALVHVSMCVYVCIYLYMFCVCVSKQVYICTCASICMCVSVCVGICFTECQVVPDKRNRQDVILSGVANYFNILKYRTKNRSRKKPRAHRTGSVSLLC